jgi:hypothetical protein
MADRALHRGESDDAVVAFLLHHRRGRLDHEVAFHVTVDHAVSFVLGDVGQRTQPVRRASSASASTVKKHLR